MQRAIVLGEEKSIKVKYCFENTR